MRKMYFLAVLIICGITIIFLLFSSDVNRENLKLLKSFGISVHEKPTDISSLTIPREFDDIYENYNFLQIQSGFNLEKYKGKQAVRYTYKITAVPNGISKNIFANVICINGKAVGGDIICPELDGFIKPLNYFTILNQ